MSCQPYIVEYIYDYRGRMIWKTIASSIGSPIKTTTYMWDIRRGAPALVVQYGFKGKWDCCPSEADTEVTDTTPSFDSL
jgi:hypothetical protein